MYSNVAPGLQEAVANRFDDAFTTSYNEKEAVRKNNANFTPLGDITSRGK